MIDNSRCGECGGALVFEEHLILTCESCGTLHGDAGLLADPTTERTFLAALDPKRPDMIERAVAVTGRPSIVERLRTYRIPFERAEDYRTMALIADAATEIERLLADPTTSRTDAEQAVIDAAIAVAHATIPGSTVTAEEKNELGIDLIRACVNVDPLLAAEVERLRGAS